MAQDPNEAVCLNSNEKTELPPIKYGERDLSDVILVVEEQEFYVHKMVLAARSKYFKALFYGNFKEKDENLIEIKEVSRIGFKRLMDFMYYGMMPLNEEHPTFITNVTVNNTGFGELKTKHFDIVNKENHIKNFWKVNKEMLDLADRFDIRRNFQRYLERLLDHFMCNTPSCFACVTILMFALAHNLVLDFTRTKKHDWNFIKEWMKIAEKAKIDEHDDLGIFTLCFKVFNSCA